MHAFGILLTALLASPDAAPIPAADMATRAAAADPSVYQVSPWLDGAIIAATGLGIAIPYALSSQLIHPSCPCSPSQVNALDRTVIGNDSHVADVTSSVLVGLAWVAPVALDAADVGFSRAFAEDMTVYAEALTVNGALDTLAKYTFQRPIPVVYSGQEPQLLRSPSGYRSFYSGHTSNAVTALMTLSVTYTLRHGDAVWPWLVTGVVGVGVAALRVSAGRHFYTDVVAGAAAGAIVGYAVPKLHERPGLGRWSLAPIPGGAMLSWSGAL